MIAKALGATINLVVCLATATMIAQVIMLCYLWQAWQIDRGRVVQMLAIAQGLDLFQPEIEADPLQRGPSPEQPSMEQIIQARVSEDRDLRMREMALSSAVAELQMEQRRFVDQRDAYQRLMNDFQTRLAALKEGAEADGRAALRVTLEKLEPEQAKTFLLEMLDKKELEEVVILLVRMEQRRRAAVLGEFRTPEEITRIAEVLRLIRQGYPEAGIAAEMSQKVNPQNQNPL